MVRSSIAARAALEKGCDLYDQGKAGEAFKAFYHSAKLGNPQAKVNLANLYDAGEGVERNHEQATYWYKMAIRKGLPEAAYNLAVSYRQRGNIRWARFWFTRARDLGDEDAIEELK